MKKAAKKAKRGKPEFVWLARCKLQERGFAPWLGNTRNELVARIKVHSQMPEIYRPTRVRITEVTR